MWGESTVPGDVTNVLAIAAGTRFSLALLASGQVRAWGGDDGGATVIPGNLDGVVAIRAGHEFCLALKGDGTVAAWGHFVRMDEDIMPAFVPADLDEVVAIACGQRHALALRSDGRVVAWGYNPYGQTDVPPELRQVVSIAAGADHSLAIRANGTVVAWGGNQFGQLEIPATLRNAFAIDCSSFTSFALLSDTPPTAGVRISACHFDAARFNLRFQTLPGRAYFLQYRDRIDPSAWLLLHGVIAPNETITTSDLGQERSRFYRVWAEP
jgi:alpha-tubulin suppressor-like RCC1 family protein